MMIKSSRAISLVHLHFKTNISDISSLLSPSSSSDPVGHEEEL
jgi:hypothetical protein